MGRNSGGESSEDFSLSEKHTFCKYKDLFLSEHLKNVR
ncbi:hypothetical protein LEP1GSC021_2859 [Leptospira noguchii str. 1993005606]|uniref:Uncharacterized protein n=2 Tax=Leptospira noguchii TaxID=28182 RepID=M6YFZ0_9LEPT|nr:hypothetical protein LEP1GSC035_0028 [Leptospira noguchii str. 2007001578]EMO90756.1 hypothetical protein LEP1GSC024_1266 [Leptospira noguchii str. 2001034031]EPE85118.1 hypothetical protein LEP1GSC021_2859 [Leptospira noguchii str. 1993005606]